MISKSRRPFVYMNFKDWLEKAGINESMKKLHLSREKTKQLFQFHGIKITRGRRSKTLSPEPIRYAKEYLSKYKVGYQRLSQVSLRQQDHSVHMNEWDARKAYELEDLYVQVKEYSPKKEHNLRFVANYVNYAWHTDLHQLEKLEGDTNKKYLIAFIDDRSRKILYHKIIDDKTSKSTSEVLLLALHFNNFPKVMIIDNGLEFVGREFSSILRDCHIQMKRTHPYTPEENGKIERWWQTLERSKTQPLREPYLTQLIYQYNHVWVHRSIVALTGKKWSPEEAWQHMRKYQGQPDAKFIYE